MQCYVMYWFCHAACPAFSDTPKCPHPNWLLVNLLGENCCGVI